MTDAAKSQVLADAAELGVDLSEFEVVPECFGLYWDVPSVDDCKGCPAQKQCFSVFTKTVTRTRDELGDGANLSTLAETLDVSPNAVLLAMGGSVDEAVDNVVRLERPKQPPVDATAEKAAEKKRRKKKPPPPPQENPENPTRARPAPSAAGPGCSGKTIPARCAEEPDTRRHHWRRMPWPEVRKPPRSWKTRRTKEQSSSPWIRMLVPGTVLERFHGDRIHRVHVTETAFWYQGRAYATLSEVTKLVAGTCRVRRYLRPDGKWEKAHLTFRQSPTRFWKLKELMTQGQTSLSILA